MTIRKLGLFLFVFTFLTGCGSKLTDLTVSKQEKEREIQTLITQHKDELEKKVKEVVEAKDKVIESKDKQITGGANAMYAADLAFTKVVTPTRTELIINNYVKEGWQALGRRMPDAETMMQIAERLKRELDEKQTSFARLEEQHVAEMVKNQKISDEAKAMEYKADRLEKELATLKQTHAKVEEKKREEVSKLQDEIISLQKKDLDNKKELNETKTKISAVAGGLALLCLAGAIWSPVFKDKLGLCAGIFGLICIGIWYIQPWHVALAAGLGLIAVGFFVIRNHAIEKTTATDVYRAIESFKNKSKEKYEQYLKPELTEWITKYDKSGKKKENTAAIDHIDNRLREMGDK